MIVRKERMEPGRGLESGRGSFPFFAGLQKSAIRDALPLWLVQLEDSQAGSGQAVSGVPFLDWEEHP
jgi:hypothetical protein